MSQGAAGRVGNLFAQAVMLHQQGSLSEAERGYRLVLAADKQHAGALQYLAMLEGQRDNFAQAVRLLRQCVKAHPRLVEARTNLGFALAQMGQHAEAVACYDKVLSIDPKFLTALNNRGISLRELGQHDEALSNYDRLLSLKPDFADAHYNRGNVLNLMGRHAEALASFETALAITPNDVQTLIGRARALYGARRWTEAVRAFDAALAFAPDNVTAHAGRGDALSELKEHAEAVKSYQRVLTLDPHHSYALGMLTSSAISMCDWELAERNTATLLDRIRAGRAVIPPFAALAVCDDPAIHLTAAETLMNRVFLHRQPALADKVRRARAPKQERLRIAYLSSDFRRHATVHLIAGLLERHDRAQFEVIGVSTGADDGSPERHRIIAAVDDFIDASQLNDAEAARRLHARGVDLLVDLNIHTLGGRLGIAARRPAPLQVNYLGYPGTSGTTFLDYVIADEIILPARSDTVYSEKIVRLPEYYAAYHLNEQVDSGAPPRDRLGIPGNAFVFCSFNKCYKISSPVFAVWMRLLQAVEGSIIWLLYDTQAAADNLRREAAKRGVDPARIIFAPPADLREHLLRQRCADLFLDTLPVNAHTTACDALWMGLPIVTCSGEAFAGRVAASALTSCGLSELVTTNLDDYLALALKLAGDPALLASVRKRLAGARTTAAVFNPDRLGRQMEAAYLTMWEIYRAGDPPRGFSVDRR